MDTGDQASVNIARLLFDNHWLSHARQKCQAILANGSDGRDEVIGLLNDIDGQLLDGEAFDLSRDHTPISILAAERCIISTLHFRYLTEERLKREAFKQGVYYIDVETSSQCNRKCTYCPNSQNDRFSTNKMMSDSVYKSFVDDLNVIDYARELHFVGYNEPLLYIDDLLGRIALARIKLPRATLVVYTNGDFLEKEGVERLAAAGADQIKISVHLPVGKSYSDESIVARINKIAKKLATPIVLLEYTKDEHIFARLVHDRIHINIYQTDYERLGSNRASTLENVGIKIDVRSAACLMPIYQFIIGHKGAVVPCCVMVSDDPRNAKYVMGNVSESPSIFDTYCNNNFVQWRRSLFNLAPKQQPCEKCSWDVASPLLNTPAIYEPWQHLVSPASVSPLVIA